MAPPKPKRFRRSPIRIPHPHLPHLNLTQVRVLRLFALLFVFSVLVVYGVFRSTRFQELMRRKAERILSAKVGRAVTIGGFDLALVPPSFVVRDVTVANDPRGLAGPCFSAAEIELLGWPTITGNRIDLPKLRVLSPRVVFEIFQDGTTNFPSLPKSDTEGGPDVRLREAVLQKATFRFREWEVQIDALLQDAALTGRSGIFSSVTHAALACRRARFRLENNQTLEFEIGAQVTLAPGRAHLDGLHLRGEKLSVDAEGGIDNLRKPVIALTASAASTGEALRELFGLGLPLSGPIRTAGSIRIGEPGGFRIRGGFELAGANTFGPFPMTGVGFVSVDPRGLIAHLAHGTYAGGVMEAAVRLDRLKNPPLPVRIDVQGRGIDFEQFFSDIGLKGTGMMARADIETTLTFGRGGIEHADGAGSFRLTADASRPSAVKGRHALPVSGGGPLLVRDGKILFGRLPLTTAGGASIRLDGTLAFGSWTPDLTLDVTAPDLKEVERIADNFYPAINKAPLTPPLLLGGSGHVVGRITRSFSDPRVEGRLNASGFVLHGVPFGEASAEFVVDRNTLTLSPFTAADAGGTLTATGPLAWGGALGSQYRLDGLVADFRKWPIERVLKFLDFDLPLAGPVTGRLPLSGVTPQVTGTVPLVWEDATAWGQKVDRLEGVLRLEKDRLSVADLKATLQPGRAAGSGFFRYADKGYEISLDVNDVPVDLLAGVKEGFAGLSGVLSGSIRGRGTIDRPTLEAQGTLREAAWAGAPLSKEGKPVAFWARASGGEWSARITAPEAAAFDVSTLARGTRRAVQVSLKADSLAPYSALLGLSSDAGFDGALVGEATVFPSASGAPVEAEGVIREARLSAFGKSVTLKAPLRFRAEGGKLVLEKTTLVEADATAPSTLTFGGSIGMTSPYPLALSVSGALDAALLKAFLTGSELSGKIALETTVAGNAARPELTGHVTLDGVDYAPTAGAPALESITGVINLSPGRVSTGALSLRYRSGTVDLSGSLALDGLKPAGIRVNATLARVKADPFEGFHATFSGNLVLTGDTTVRAARGELVFDHAVYDEDIPLDLSLILSKLRPSATIGPAPGTFDAVALEVSLLAPAGAIEIHNNLARVKLSGNLVARGTVGRPILFGQLEAEEGGRLVLKDVKYELVSGRILFSNPRRIEPFFELEARTNVTAAQVSYQITVGLSGTSSRLVPRFTSDPALSDAQIVSLLATGDLPTSTTSGIPLGVGPASSDEAISRAARELIAGLATQAITSRTKGFFRLDRLQIDPIFLGSSLEAPRVTIGKSISKDLTATFAYQLGSSTTSQQQQIITLEYQLSPSAFLQAVQDQYGVYSLEIKLRQRLR